MSSDISQLSELRYGRCNFLSEQMYLDRKLHGIVVKQNLLLMTSETWITCSKWNDAKKVQQLPSQSQAEAFEIKVIFNTFCGSFVIAIYVY